MSDRPVRRHHRFASRVETTSGRRPPGLEPARVCLTKVDGRTIVPAGSIRVDRATRWRSPFWLDQLFIIYASRRSFNVDTRGNRMRIVTQLHFAWMMGLTLVHPAWAVPSEIIAELPEPPNLLEVERHLRGRVLADWAPIGQPCIGDVLLAIANRKPDGSLFPTPSDDFKPDNSYARLSRERRDREYQISRVGW